MNDGSYKLFIGLIEDGSVLVKHTGETMIYNRFLFVSKSFYFHFNL